MIKPISATEDQGEAGRIGLSATPSLRASIVKWAEQQPDAPELPEAVRRLVEIALALQPSRRATTQKARASEMAGATIDRLVDERVAPDEKASRKRRLLKGPDELRDTSADKPKPGG